MVSGPTADLLDTSNISDTTDTTDIPDIPEISDIPDCPEITDCADIPECDDSSDVSFEEENVTYTSSGGETLEIHRFVKDGVKMISMNGIDLPLESLLSIIGDLDVEADEADEADEAKGGERAINELYNLDLYVVLTVYTVLILFLMNIFTCKAF